MKRAVSIPALLLALLMLLPVVVACKKNTPDTEDSGSESVSETVSETETDPYGQVVLDKNIPDELDFGGETVNFLVRKAENYKREWYTEEITDTLSQEIYKRNGAVQTELGVQLKFITEDGGKDNETFNTKILNAGKSGLGEIDIVSNYAAYSANPNLTPYYLNLYSNQMTYLDLSRPYWNQEYVDAGRSFGRLFFVVGDLNLSVYDRMIVTFFNKKLVEEYGASYGIPDLYATAIAGDWDYEMFYNIIKNVPMDNGTYEDKSDDIYMVSSAKASEALFAFAGAFNLSFTKTNDDGTHEFVVDSEQQKLVLAFEKASDFLTAAGANMPIGAGDSFRSFVNNNSIFLIDIIYRDAETNSQLQNMTNGFGVIPCPKYDSETQDRYYSAVQDAHNTVSVMYIGRQNYDMISAVLELLNSKSYSDVRPYYIEKVVKSKNLDQRSAECISLILDGASFDFSDIYGSQVGTRSTMWASPLMHGRNLSDDIIANLDIINGMYDDVDEWLKNAY